MKTITEFLDKHNACPDGRERARAFSSLEDAWNRCDPSDLIWLATRPGVLTEKELRLSAVFCARQVEHLLTDDRSRAAIDTAERYACGKATDEELVAARAAAYAVAYAAAGAAAAVAEAAAASAADAVADAAARAAHAVAYAAARAARASDAARAAYAAWLRENTTPDFS